METSKLKEILEKHKKWVNNEEGGEKADLSGADLRWADLCGADLSSANLRLANLSDADLRWANLRWADLCGADLSSANLRSADLSRAYLSRAYLSGADLSSADLRWADLRSANLFYFTYNRHTAYFQFDGKIRIGCEYHDIDWWIENYKEVGKKESYTESEIRVYGGFIGECKKLQKEHDEKKETGGKCR